MSASTLSSTDLHDILVGACLLGGGGGGPMSGALPLIAYIETHRLQIHLVSPGDLPQSGMAGVVAGIGAPDAATHGPAFTVAPKTALTALSKAVDAPFIAVLPGETGAMNSIIPALVAGQLGLPLVDVDSAGRALPTLNLAAYNLATPPNPLILANQTDDPANAVLAQLNTPTPEGADALVRGLVTASAFGNEGAFATWALPIQKLYGASVSGTVSRSLRVGKALRLAKSTGANPLEAVIQALDGKAVVLAQGAIASVDTVEGGGFDTSHIAIGTGDGADVTVVAVNENLLAWKRTDATPLAAAPDTLAWLTFDGDPLSNADISSKSVGTKVWLLGVPAAPILRSPSLAAGFQAQLSQIGFLGRAPVL